MNRRSKSWVGREQSSCLSTKLTFWKTWIIDKFWLVNFVVGLSIPILFCVCFPFFCRLWNVTKNDLKLNSACIKPVILYITRNVQKAPTRFWRWAFIFFELVEASCQNGKQIQHKSSISLTQSICQYSYMDVKRVFTFLDVEERAGICVVMGFYIIQFGENDWLTGFFKACCYTNTPTLLKKISLGKVF